MKKLRKFIVIIRVSFTNAITYKASLLSRFIFYTLFIYIFMSLWKSIYLQGSVHGYSYQQIIWYLIMTEFIGFASGGDIYRSMNEDVKTGSIAYQIGRPIHYVSYQFANSLGQSLLNFMSFGLLAVILGFLFVGMPVAFKIQAVIPLIVSIFLGITLHFFICMLIGLTSFFIEDNYAIFLIYQKATFMMGLFLPVEFLPEWLQNIAKNLPFSYTQWAPARIFVDYSKEMAVMLISRQLVWVVLIISLTLISYSVGIRKLQVNGG